MTDHRSTFRYTVWFAAVATAALLLPTGCAHHPDPAARRYFEGLNQTLRTAGVGHPALLLDLDRLDHNLDAVKDHLKEPFSFRATAKSLPSIELIKYALARTGSHRVMAFHWRFFKELLAGLPADSDILVGKTQPIAGVAEVWSGFDEAQREESQKRVTWLVDSPRTLKELVDFFAARRARLRVAVEIDVGLHRGGATNLTEFDAILTAIAAAGPAVTLVGLLGYDGHVPHVPGPSSMHLGSMHRSFNGLQDQYRAFRQHLERNHPKLAATCTIFDGGGSGTYRLYGPSSPVNDIALGSALLKPGGFFTPNSTNIRRASGGIVPASFRSPTMKDHPWRSLTCRKSRTRPWAISTVASPTARTKRTSSSIWTK